ncbi:MAG: type III pantothenate kinase [Clostridia bacterium]|nr:type III pantothenate kinase [Clostridia bacterium]
MLLAIDIGNSSISLGLFDLQQNTPKPVPALTAKLSAATGRTPDEYAVIIRGLLAEQGYAGRVKAAVLGSVVPQLTHTLEAAVQRLGGDTPVPVTHIEGGVRTGISLRVDDPAALGADIVTNAAAAVSLYGAPVIFLDLGTATVWGAVNMGREMVGVSIAPGVTTSLEGLRAAAAQIPYMELKPPETALGKNTTAAIRSGLLLGTACMIDGMIGRIKDEMKLPENAALPVVATGGLAELVLPSCKREVIYEPDLTLLGLYFIYKATAEREAAATERAAKKNK